MVEEAEVVSVADLEEEADLEHQELEEVAGEVVLNINVKEISN